MIEFSEFLVLQESVVTEIDSIAQKIVQGRYSPQILSSVLRSIEDALNRGESGSPHYMHMAMVVRDDILPVLRNNPLFRKSVTILDALTSAGLSG
jgi:hypothetical protein